MKNSQHLSAETVENYILNRLDTVARAEVDSHLKGCEACRERLAQERALAQAVRLSGRQTMKNEIEHQVADLKQARRERRMVLYRAAAVLLVLVFMPGLIWYQTQMGYLPSKTDSAAGLAPAPATDDIMEKEEEQVSAPVPADKLELNKPVLSQKSSSQTGGVRSAKGKIAKSAPAGQAASGARISKTDKNLKKSFAPAGQANQLQSQMEAMAAPPASRAQLAEPYPVIRFTYLAPDEREMATQIRSESDSYKTVRFVSDVGQVLFKIAYAPSDSGLIEYEILDKDLPAIRCQLRVFREQPFNISQWQVHLVGSHKLRIMQNEQMLFEINLLERVGKSHVSESE